MIKLFLDGRWLSQPHQGVSTYVIGLAEAVVAAKARGDADDIELYIGVENETVVPASLRQSDVHILPLGHHGRAWRQFLLPFVLARNGINIAHFTYVCPYIKLRMRYVTSIHDVLFLSYPDLFDRKYRLSRGPTFWLASRLSDLVLTISESSARDIRNCLHYRGSLALVYIGTEVSIRRGERPVSNAAVVPGKFLLTVGRVEKRKNYSRLCEAFVSSGLHERGFTMVVVGWPDASSLEECRKLASTPGVVWLKRVDDDELNWLYRHAQGFVFPSICEGYGIPLIEALLNNLPCATSTSYPLEDVKNVCAVQFNPYDVSQMAAALVTLCECKKVAPNTEQIVRQYSWRRSCEKYLSLIRGLQKK
jgi:glycosyltransferase involved in cell wall biosynthesis